MELIDVVDENNRLTGQVEERWTAYNKGLWRRTVSCWIMNKNGEILLQKELQIKLEILTNGLKQEARLTVEKLFKKQYVEKSKKN